MKFIHIADVHFGIPFTTLNAKGLADKRRLEQRNSFKKVIDYIRENNIEYLFICGDLYEQEYIDLSTIQYINKLFMSIPDTKIYIVPGNHDPYIKNSYYATFEFSKNVKIFTENIEKIEDQNVCIYGFGFNDFYCEENKYKELTIENKEKINILLTHCDLDGAGENGTKYNTIPKTYLEALGFDYVALGHIHKPMHDGNIVYPGSLISFGFDELGKHRYDFWRNR